MKNLLILDDNLNSLLTYIELFDFLGKSINKIIDFLMGA